MHKIQFVLKLAYPLLVAALPLSGAVGCSHSTTNGAPATATPQTLSALTFDPDPVVLRKGESKQVKATAVMGDGSKNDVSKDAQWTSENPATATVDSTGKVVGVNVGATTLDVAYKDTKGQVKVTVAP